MRIFKFVFAPLDDNSQFVQDPGLAKIESGKISPSCLVHEKAMARYPGMADNIDHRNYSLPVYAEKNRMNM